jgi:tetratricopeptide (TPR) repeat protein
VFIAGFGCPPLSHTDDARRAVDASLDILECLNFHKMPGSIGVTTGEVRIYSFFLFFHHVCLLTLGIFDQAYVGDVGSPTRREYAMVGDVVNLSARLMMSAKAGILLDRRTHDAVVDLPAFNFDWLPPIQVKGKTQPIHVFVPRRVDPSEQSHDQGHDHGHDPGQHGHEHDHDHGHAHATRTVGRKAELKVLEELVEPLSKIPPTARCIPPLLQESPSTERKSGQEANDVDGSDEDDDDAKRMLLVRSRSFTVHKEEFRQPAVCLLIGPQGIGKSHLLQDMLVHLQAHNMVALRGVGSQLESSTPYHAWFDIMEQVCLEPASEGQSNGSRELKTAVVAAVGQDEVALLNAVIRNLNAPESEVTAQMSSQHRADRTLAAALKALGAGSTPGTTFVLEDAHHLDSSSWAFLEKLSSQMCNVMIVVALRPLKSEILEYSRLKRLDSCTALDLAPLQSDKTALLAARLLRVSALPKELSAAIESKVQGNPFYIEQVCEMIRESGALQVTDRQIVHEAGLLEVMKDVPSSVTGLITTKIDRLDPAQQVILRLAAVMGRTFSVSMLESLLPLESDISMDRLALLRQLAALERLDLIELHTPDPARSYVFGSTLVMEVIYNAMLFSHRRDVHLKLAELYEDIHLGQAQFDAVLAYHKEHGGSLKEAQRLYVKAGSRQLAQYAIAEAVELLQAAVKLIISRGKEGSLTHIIVERKLGQAFLNRGLAERARTHFEEALRLLGIDLSPESKSTPGMAKKILRRRKSQVVGEKKGGSKRAITKKWKFTSEGELAKPAQLAHRKREAVITLLGLASVNYLASNHAPMLFCAGAALELARDQGNAEQCEALCAMILSAEDDAVAAEWITEARSLAQQRTELLKVVCLASGSLYAGRRYWARAQKAFRETIGFARDVGDSRTLEVGLTLSSTAFVLQGNFAEALEPLTEALSSAMSRSDFQTSVMALNAEAFLRCLKGEMGSCSQVLEQVKLQLESTGSTDITAELNYNGTAAVLSARMRQGEDCLHFVDRLNELLNRTEPTAFFAFPGFSALPEVFYVALRDEKLADQFGERGGQTSLVASLREANVALAKFAAKFPIAQPRVDFWTAVVSHFEGKTARAEKEFGVASERAKEYLLSYDQALIHYEQGMLSDNADLVESALKSVPRLRRRKPGAHARNRRAKTARRVSSPSTEEQPVSLRRKTRKSHRQGYSTMRIQSRRARRSKSDASDSHDASRESDSFDSSFGSLPDVPPTKKSPQSSTATDAPSAGGPVGENPDESRQMVVDAEDVPDAVGDDARPQDGTEPSGTAQTEESV